MNLEAQHLDVAEAKLGMTDYKNCIKTIYPVSNNVYSLMQKR